jgi:hypothetical protein
MYSTVRNTVRLFSTNIFLNFIYVVLLWFRNILCYPFHWVYRDSKNNELKFSAGPVAGVPEEPIGWRSHNADQSGTALAQQWSTVIGQKMYLLQKVADFSQTLYCYVGEWYLSNKIIWEGAATCRLHRMTLNTPVPGRDWQCAWSHEGDPCHHEWLLHTFGVFVWRRHVAFFGCPTILQLGLRTYIFDVLWTCTAKYFLQSNEDLLLLCFYALIFG